MRINILRLQVSGLNLFHDGKLSVDFITDKKTPASQVEDNTVEHLFNSIYKLNTMTFLGVNAAGKTTAINLVSDILTVYLGNKGLESSFVLSNHFKSVLDVEAYFYDHEEKAVYRMCSKIKKIEYNHLVFVEEYLYILNKLSGITSKNIFDDQNYLLETSRTEVKSEYLKSDDSIFSRVMNKNGQEFIFNLSLFTNDNTLLPIPKLLELQMMTAKFLDHSIEYLHGIVDERNSVSHYKLKFKNNEEELVLPSEGITKYLSPGTVNGIRLMTFVFTSLQFGGYVIIDDIENNFNKIIVEHIIKFFMSDLNLNSATLIYSTYYSELVDSIERSDSIYLAFKDQDIHIEKYSNYGRDYDKSDKKKSNVLLSGVLNTAPNYVDYKKLRRFIS